MIAECLAADVVRRDWPDANIGHRIRDIPADLGIAIHVLTI